MVVHLFQHEKVTKPYIDFINQNFQSSYHLFLLASNPDKDSLYNDYDNVIIIRNTLKLFQVHKKYFKLADKIIIHGLFSSYLILSLNFNSRYLDKCYWVIWGGDLYNAHNNRNSSLTNRTLYLLRSRVIKSIGHYVTYIKGDYDFAKKIHQSNALFHHCIMYHSNVYHHEEYNYMFNKTKCIRVLVGNSASKTNNHLEVYDKLKNYKNILVYSPLSYGDQNYMKKVIEYGTNIFKQRFFPLTEFVPADEYKRMLNTMNLAIFNNYRQEAMGNIITLLGLGKKVFLRSDITTWDFFSEIGVKVFDINFDKIFANFHEDDRLNNIQLINKYFSIDSLKNDWENIFNKS